MRSINVLRRAKAEFIKKLYGDKNSAQVSGFTSSSLYRNNQSDIDMLPIMPAEPLQNPDGTFTFVLGESDWSDF